MSTPTTAGRPIRFAAVVRDVRERTETACPQRHTFEVMRLAITAQQNAAMAGFAR